MTNTAIKMDSHYNKVIEESMTLLLDYNLVKFANSGGSIDDLIEYFTETSSSDIVEEYFNNDHIILKESFNENYDILLEETEYILENAAAANIARGLKWLFKVGVGGSRGGPNIFQRSATSLKNIFKKIKNLGKKSGPQNVNIPPPNRPSGNGGRGGTSGRSRTPAGRRNQNATQRQQRVNSMRNRTTSPKNKEGLRKRDLAKIALGGAALYTVAKGTADLLSADQKNKGIGGPEETPRQDNPPTPRPGIDVPATSRASSDSTPSRPAQTPSRPAQTPSRPAQTPSRPKETLPASLPSAPSTDTKRNDLAQWEKANKILAIAAAERKRIRGTSQTDNPLMQDLKSRLPDATPEYQAPEVASLGKGNQSLKDNPNAKKKKAMSEQLQVSKNDAYLIVSDYLLKNGHADSIEESFYIAAGMDVNTVMDIVESYHEASSLYNEEGA